MSNEQDANTTAAPSAEVTPVSSEATQADAQSVSQPTEKQTELPFHEHPRFKEIIDERNDLRRTVDELKSQVEKALSAQSSGDLENEVTKEYLELGIKDDAAKKMARLALKTADKMASYKTSKLEQEVKQMKANMIISSFANEHSDFNEVKPKMLEMYNSFDPQTRAWYDEHPEAVEKLYTSAKTSGMDVEAIRKSSYEEGLKAGLNKIKTKQAISPTTGASVTAPNALDLSDEAIAKMSPAEFAKNKEAIFKSRGIVRPF